MRRRTGCGSAQPKVSGSAADLFQRAIWRGWDSHLGLYCRGSIPAARAASLRVLPPLLSGALISSDLVIEGHMNADRHLMYKSFGKGSAVLYPPIILNSRNTRRLVVLGAILALKVHIHKVSYKVCSYFFTDRPPARPSPREGRSCCHCFRPLTNLKASGSFCAPEAHDTPEPRGRTRSRPAVAETIRVICGGASPECHRAPSGRFWA